MKKIKTRILNKTYLIEQIQKDWNPLNNRTTNYIHICHQAIKKIYYETLENGFNAYRKLSMKNKYMFLTYCIPEFDFDFLKASDALLLIQKINSGFEKDINRSFELMINKLNTKSIAKFAVLLKKIQNKCSKYENQIDAFKEKYDLNEKSLKIEIELGTNQSLNSIIDNVKQQYKIITKAYFAKTTSHGNDTFERDLKIFCRHRKSPDLSLIYDNFKDIAEFSNDSQYRDSVVRINKVFKCFYEFQKKVSIKRIKI